MTTKLKDVDVVVVGLGWTGGILSKELAEAGLKVVALERGAMRTPANDYSLPNIRDELRYAVHKDLMMNTARDTLTVRNHPSQEALPMRRLGSFLPGEVVGGAAVHWSGHTWRWTDMEFRIRSQYEERYGKKFIPEDMTIQDWGITYAELEPYYDKFERTAAVSGRARSRSTATSLAAKALSRSALSTAASVPAALSRSARWSAASVPAALSRSAPTAVA